MDQVFLKYLHENYANGFGMSTTSTIPFALGEVAGSVQLKWWKQQGTLIIKEIQINPIGGNLLTPAVNAVLSDPTATKHGLQTIVLESVLSPDLRKKLISRGWKAIPYNEYNLFIDRHF
uniref:Uncharacterized protein n=1 Tax=viral metagenome TaxID=1070528 RepID=A0A6C0KUW5_9ZZZZ